MQIRFFSARRGLFLGALALALAGCSPAVSPPPPAATVVPAPQATAVPQATAAPQPQSTAAPQATAAPQPDDPQAGEPRRISFAPHTSSAAVEGAVVRGSRDRFLLWAAAGQEMRVSLTSLEQNGAVVITAPEGAPLPGAEPGADASAWSGLLPASGDYTIEVGPTRGNLSYRLEVAVTTPVPAPAPAGAIRSTDWAARIASDPAFRHETQPDGRLYITLRAGGELAGIPLLDSVVYGDFSGDGREEAAIMLASGGTAGNVGLLVYREGPGGPELAAWRNGYKLWAAAESGQLLVREPIYAGWEANCCPTGLSTVLYRLGGGGLEATEQRSEGVAEAQPYVVEHFYDLIRAGELAGAYALLSDAEQAANPFEAWAAGFANTVDLVVSAERDPAAADRVWVTIDATDRTADGGQITRRFAGTWGLVWVAGRPGWALTSPQIQPVP